MDDASLTEVGIDCPYCGEPISTVVDPGAGEAAYVEDCPVCCAPMELTIRWFGDLPEVTVARDDD